MARLGPQGLRPWQRLTGVLRTPLRGDGRVWWLVGNRGPKLQDAVRLASGSIIMARRAGASRAAPASPLRMRPASTSIGKPCAIKMASAHPRGPAPARMARARRCRAFSFFPSWTGILPPAFESVDTWNRDLEARRTASAPANSAARPRRHTIGNGGTVTSSE